MGDRSAIEWTDATWNPVTGCSKVSRECDHCYAEALSLRLGWSKQPWAPEHAEENVVLHPERLNRPFKWRQPRMVFVNSMSDLFHPRVPTEFIRRVFDVMQDAPRHTFQVLTKRPKRMRDWCNQFQPEPLPNVWLGTSIGERAAIGRADLVRETPAAVRFISAEPLLESLVDIMSCSTCWDWPDADCDECEGAQWWYSMESLDLSDIDWLIVGGESGHGHRPCKPEWVRELRDAALHHQEIMGGPAFFFKQWGGRTPKTGGRELDGRTWDQMPTVEAVTS